MPYTRMHGVARILVGVVKAEYIPDFVPWSYDGVSYDLDVEVEETPLADSNIGDMDVDTTKDGDGDGNGY